MMKNNKKPSRLAKAMIETAGDMRHAGIMDESAYEKITLRHLGIKGDVGVKQLTGEDIRAMRDQAHMSQAGELGTGLHKTRTERR